MSKPAFDPSKPFQVVEKPSFDQSQPFEERMFKEVKKTEPKISMEDVAEMVKAEIKKAIASQRVVERVIEHKTVEKLVEKKEKDFAEKSEIAELKEIIEDLKKQVKEKAGDIIVQGVPPAFPDYRGPDQKVLANTKGVYQWVTQSASDGTGGLTEVYTASNVNALRTFDADSITFDQLCDVVGTLIQDLSA